MREKRGVYRFSVGKPEIRSHLAEDESIILIWIFKKWVMWLRTETGGGLLRTR
jgi:hypothetical protein